MYLATMLLGNNIALVVFSIFMEGALEPHIEHYIASHWVVLFVQTFISTMIILTVAEFLPKNIFRYNPNTAINILAIPVWIIYQLFSPIVYFTTKSAEWFMRTVFGIDTAEREVVFRRIDLDHYLREATESVKEKQDIEHEVQIFRKALDFSRVKARDCMIPRTEIIALEANDGIEVLKQKFIETRLSKILIYNESIDNIVGYTHSYELFKNPDSIKSILRPVLIVPESMPAREALTSFIQQHKSIAVVVDEFGGTSGMLTIEDVMEEIFGEIEDEHDKDELVERVISENEFVFSGRLEIEYLNTKYHFKIPTSEDYKTLSGYIIHEHESIPRLNEKIVIPPLVFKITGISETRIELVNMRKQ